MKGQEKAKRALEIAAAGGHHLLMIGPPGTGKSMLAARLPGILPPLEPDEALETSMIHSVAGLLDEGGISPRPAVPHPAPHRPMAAMVGGGRSAKPGEVSLAHHGVLFLDELPEFPRAGARDPAPADRDRRGGGGPRQRPRPLSLPLQAGRRREPLPLRPPRRPRPACGRAPDCGADYPAASPGRCSTASTCGWRCPPSPSPTSPCRRPASARPRRARVARARAVQPERFAGHAGVAVNADAEGELLESITAPTEAAAKLVADVAPALPPERPRLPPGAARRPHHRRPRGLGPVEKPHVAEAAGYRLAF